MTATDSTSGAAGEELRLRAQLRSIAESAAEATRNGRSVASIYAELDSGLWEYRRESAARSRQYTFSELRKEFPSLNPPVIEGLFREGETCNIIADPKRGKSWLVYGMALSIVAGRKWLDRFETAPGPVLIVDNELHQAVLAHRIPMVAAALGIRPEDYERDLHVRCLRGRWRSLSELAHEFQDIDPGAYKAIIFDAKYRFATKGVSENDNSDETQLYNLLDMIGQHTLAANILIHHSSKGSQSEKAVTDVGAGAGAQARAADCHLVLRPHEEPGVVVLEAAVRSFPPTEPMALAWKFPVWRPVGADTTKLKGRGTPRQERQQQEDREATNKIVDVLRKDGPKTARKLRAAVGMSKDRVERLLSQLVTDGHLTVKEITIRGNNCDEYALIPVSAD